MIFTIVGIIIVLGLIFFTVVRFVPAPAKISQPVSAYDNQFEVFRDMEPATQTRFGGAWMGFLQEDVGPLRNGPIGNFIGNDSGVGNARLYNFT